MNPFEQIVSDLNICMDKIQLQQKPLQSSKIKQSNDQEQQSKSVYDRLTESKYYTGTQKEKFKNPQNIVNQNLQYIKEQQLNKFTDLGLFLRPNDSQDQQKEAPTIKEKDCTNYLSVQNRKNLSQAQQTNLYSSKFYNDSSIYSRFNKRLIQNDLSK